MRYLTHILTLILLALALEVSAQEYRNIRDFEYIRSATPWISSDNAAGLDALPVGRIANIEAFFHKHDGELRDINESANSFEAGASTEAFISLSELFAIHGRLEYRNFNGKGIAFTCREGSFFLSLDYCGIYHFPDLVLRFINSYRHLSFLFSCRCFFL